MRGGTIDFCGDLTVGIGDNDLTFLHRDPVSGVGRLVSQRGNGVSTGIWKGIILCVGSSGFGNIPLQSLSRGERQALSLECLCLSDGSGEALLLEGAELFTLCEPE